MLNVENIIGWRFQTYLENICCIRPVWQRTLRPSTISGVVYRTQHAYSSFQEKTCLIIPYLVYLYIYNTYILLISACTFHNTMNVGQNYSSILQSSRHPPGTRTQPGGRDLRSHRVHPAASSSNWMGIMYSKPPEVFL